MSAISEKVRAAIYEALTADGDLMVLAPGGVHFLVAPPNTPNAFIVLGRIPVSIIYALRGMKAERDLVTIKAIVGSDFDPDKSGSQLAEEILVQVDGVLLNGVEITGEAVTYFKRTNEIPPYLEAATDREFHHHGANYTVITETV